MGPPANFDPHAPDGGWGWVVCFGSFMLQALTIGITYTFGIIFVELLEYFDTTEAEASWIGSIQPCLLYFTGEFTRGSAAFSRVCSTSLVSSLVDRQHPAVFALLLL